MKRTKNQAGAANNLPKRLLSAMESRSGPLEAADFLARLQLPKEQLSAVQSTLLKLEREGSIVRVRRNRYVLPDAADLATGIIKFRAGGSAWVVPGEGGEIDVSPDDTGTAMNGDTVVVRLNEESLRAKGSKQRKEAKRSVTPAEKVRRKGRVVRVVVRAHETLVGTLDRSKRFTYVVPDDRRLIHDIYVNLDESETPARPRPGDKVLVRLAAWESRHVNPEGVITEVLGRADDPGIDLRSVVVRYRLPGQFPEAVLAEAEAIPERVLPREIDGRVDCRDLPLVTIDPDDARDFDDAVLVEKLPRGGWRLHVHIADVSHYVVPGAALDLEAYRRGNSVYLPDRVIPMLPERLSNGTCSLVPHVERLTRGAVMEFSRNGTIRSARFVRAVIRSSARLTYREAFAALESPARDDLSSRLHTAWELAELLRRRRFAAGSLDLEMPELKVRVDETGRARALERVEHDRSHQLIEEFMLAANEAVAQATRQRLVPSLYRVHDAPDPEKLAEFRELARQHGFEIGSLEVRSELLRLIGMMRGRPEERAMKSSLLRSLAKARYEPDPKGHYGLAKSNYTHFTSPIRRYADLVVHRVLGVLFEDGGAPRTPGRGGPKRVAPDDLSHVAKHISAQEELAAEAERESVALKKVEFFARQLQDRRPEPFDAVVVEVRNFGLFIELPEVLTTGLIHVSSFADDFYRFDPVRLRFVGQRRKRTFGLGDKLRVIVSRVDRFKRQIDFIPV